MVELSQVFGVYLPLFIGALAQLVFLWLPVKLSNWTDDLLNVLTYMCIQVFVACVLFVGLPRLFDLFRLDDIPAFFLLVGVTTLSLMRALKLIPLEFTHARALNKPAPIRLNFDEFYEPERLRMIAESTERAKDPMRTYITLRECLWRRKPEKSEGPASSAVG